MMRVSTQTLCQIPAEARTPRPNPQFFAQPQTFSTKKERSTPRDALPPKHPVKSVPPLSRVFAHRQIQRAKAVSFRSSETSTAIVSPHYDEGNRSLYFDQCFQIEGKIGAGSFGEVFKVRSLEDNQLYAVKRSRERFRGEADRKRKLEEVAKHEKLPKHPNCVGFFKAWEEKEHLYIQAELCQASLSDLAEENHDIPERLVWNYLVDLIMAVKHLHDNDLVHMDIKPDNIFIGFDGLCKLGDFGLVLDVSNGVDFSEAQEGDPKYLAPELMQGKFGKPADVFSLGISILELASDLDLPRGGETWHQLRSGRLPEQFLQGISEELKKVIRVMMEPDPSLRPSAEQLLLRHSVRQVWRRRKREYAMQKASVLPEQMAPLKSPTRPTQGHPPEWDHSFSDDEVFDADISIHNNSMGVPLDASSESDESFPLASGSFLIPSLPRRRAFTAPSNWRKPGDRIATPNKSPLLLANGCYSSSPIRSPVSLSFCHHDDSSITSDSSPFKDDSVVMEEDVSRVNIEPKNLMQAFANASSSEDE